MKKNQKSEKEANIVDRSIEAYEAAQAELDDFLIEYRKTMETLHQLVEIRNYTLDMLQRSLKQRLLQSDQNKLIVGGFGAQKKISRWYDGEYLANELPARLVDLVIEEQIVYKVKTEELEDLVRSGEVDKEIVKKAYHEEKPTAAMLPGMPKPYIIPALPNEEG